MSNVPVSDEEAERSVNSADSPAAPVKTSSWSDAEREHRSDVPDAPVPGTLEDAVAAAGGPPPWAYAFESGDLVIHRGWWCRIYGGMPMPDAAGKMEWVVILKPEQPTSGEKKRLAAVAARAQSKGPVKL